MQSQLTPDACHRSKVWVVRLFLTIRDLIAPMVMSPQAKLPWGKCYEKSRCTSEELSMRSRHFPCKGHGFWSLVEELRSHMPRSQIHTQMCYFVVLEVISADSLS